MPTTVTRIPDEVLHGAKAIASLQGETTNEVLVEAWQDTWRVTGTKSRRTSNAPRACFGPATWTGSSRTRTATPSTGLAEAAEATQG